MNTKKIRGGNNLVKYKNMITGEFVLGPEQPKIYIIDGKEFIEIYDSKLRNLKIAKDSLQKVRSN